MKILAGFLEYLLSLIIFSFVIICTPKLSELGTQGMAGILGSGVCPGLRSGVCRNKERDPAGSRHAGLDPAYSGQ
jgi:hypothetical protein